MTKTITTVLLLALCTSLGCAQIAAGLNDGQDAKKESVTSTEKAKDALAGPPGPKLDAAKRAALLQCSDITRSDLIVGKSKSYKVTQGMNSTDYTGLIERREAKIENGCFVQLNAGECFSMQVEEAKLKEMGGDWQMQCVESAAPEKGAIQYGTVPPSRALSNLTGKHIILKCGHDQGDSYTCSEANNSGRAGEFKKAIQAKGQKQVSMCATFPESNDPAQYVNKHVYCQYYNTSTKKSLYAVEFLRAK